MTRNPQTERGPTEQANSQGDSDDQLSNADRTDLIAEVELLERKVERLQNQLIHARKTRHHRAAVGLALVGFVAGSGGLVFPASRTALFTLATTGLFAAVLTYYLTPERFIAASVGERIYTATASLRDELVADLGLTNIALYVPVQEAGSESFAAVRLFIPQHHNYRIPSESVLGSPIIATDDHRCRGLSMRPSSAALVSEFDQTLSDGLASDPAELATQLRDALVTDLELVDNVTVSYDEQTESMTFGIGGSVYGDVTRFDHPISSFVATGLSEGLEAPIQLETTVAEDSQTDFLVTCRWSEDAVYRN